MRIAPVRVEGHVMRKIVHQIVNLAHKVVGIGSSELYPVTDKDLVKRKGNSKIQGNADEQS